MANFLCYITFNLSDLPYFTRNKVSFPPISIYFKQENGSLHANDDMTSLYKPTVKINLVEIHILYTFITLTYKIFYVTVVDFSINGYFSIYQR